MQDVSTLSLIYCNLCLSQTPGIAVGRDPWSKQGKFNEHTRQLWGAAAATLDMCFVPIRSVSVLPSAWTFFACSAMKTTKLRREVCPRWEEASISVCWATLSANPQNTPHTVFTAAKWGWAWDNTAVRGKLQCLGGNNGWWKHCF